MCLKANKVQITQIEDDIYQNYVKKGHIQELLKEAEIFRIEKERKINSNKEDKLNNQIIDIASELFNEKARRYEDIYQNFKGYFNSSDLK